MTENTNLLIHLGGLGDACLSESIFFSLFRYYEEGMIGLGNKRFLQLFKEYFTEVESVEIRKWIYLFSNAEPRTIWKRIIFIGKDRHGYLRKRWQRFSQQPLIFIDMYPDIAMEKEQGIQGVGNGKILDHLNPGILEPEHIETYQLRQLAAYGIRPLIKTINPRPSRRVILYPETGFIKEKWDMNNFISLYERLRSQGIMVVVLQALDTPIPVKERIYIEDIAHVKSIFQEGGIFFSNDSGMAHLAGACGLFTITLFFQYDPRIWHPRGSNICLIPGKDSITVDSIAGTIMEILAKA